MSLPYYWVIVNRNIEKHEGADKAYYQGTQGGSVVCGKVSTAIKYISYAAAQLVLTGTFGVVLTEANEWDIVQYSPE